MRWKCPVCGKPRHRILVVPDILAIPGKRRPFACFGCSGLPRGHVSVSLEEAAQEAWPRATEEERRARCMDAVLARGQRSAKSGLPRAASRAGLLRAAKVLLYRRARLQSASLMEVMEARNASLGHSGPGAATIGRVAKLAAKVRREIDRKLRKIEGTGRTGKSGDGT